MYMDYDNPNEGAGGGCRTPDGSERRAGAPVHPQGAPASPAPPPPVQQARSDAHAAGQYPPPPYYGYGYGYGYGGPYGPAPEAAPAKKGGRVALIVILALVAAIVVGAASCARSMSQVDAFGVGGDSGFEPNTVAVITMDGTIQYDGTECSPEGLKSLLDEAEESDDVKAVVLRVDSGGGTATAGEEMAAYVRDFGKPVVVSSASLNASAAYEISSQADYIYVAKTTEIGSIGTVMQVTDFSELLEKLGVNVDNIASAQGKDSSYGTRPLTDEERQYYQDMIDQINSVFVENVAAGRGMSVEEVQDMATGLTWTGMTAVENGIADEVGTLEDACDKAAELGGCADDYTTQDLSTSSSEVSELLDLLSSSTTGQDITAEDVASALKELEDNDSSIR